MTATELKDKLQSIRQTLSFEETAEWLTVNVDSAEFHDFALELRDQAELDFDFLFCVTCVDWKTHLSMVYHLRSLGHMHSIVVKCKLDREKPEIQTVSDLWHTAEFHEREAYDLFGVKFTGHPDLRRLFLTDDWVGWPLRKDYDDPVNMIKL